MVDRDVQGLGLQKVHTGPLGNLFVHRATLALSSAAAGDDYFVMPLAQGMSIYEVDVVVTDAAASGDTLDVGTQQKGEGTWTDNETQFFSNVNLASTGGSSSIKGGIVGAGSYHGPVLVDQPEVYLTCNIDNAIGTAFEVVFYVKYEFVGNL